MELHNVYIVTTGRSVGVFTRGPRWYLLGTARGSTDLRGGGSQGDSYRVAHVDLWPRTNFLRTSSARQGLRTISIFIYRERERECNIFLYYIMKLPIYSWDIVCSGLYGGLRPWQWTFQNLLWIGLLLSKSICYCIGAVVKTLLVLRVKLN